MKFIFHPDAEAEFQNSIEYYEERQENLGYDFAFEVHCAIQRAVDFPESWPTIKDEVRRSLVHRFPFGILYAIEEGSIVVVAVMHLHQQSDYWIGRI